MWGKIMEYEDCVAIATIVRKTTVANQRIPLVNALGRYITKEMHMELTIVLTHMFLISPLLERSIQTS